MLEAFRFQISWSKIVALFAFGARLAQYCQERDMPVLVFDVASNLSQFAVEKLTPFLREHGGMGSDFADFQMLTTTGRRSFAKSIVAFCQIYKGPVWGDVFAFSKI